MSEKITRRAFGVAVLGTAASLAVPAAAQTGAPSAKDRLKGLAPEPTKEIADHLGAAMAGITAQSVARWAVKLPEGSEPCTIYVPTPANPAKEQKK